MQFNQLNEVLRCRVIELAAELFNVELENAAVETPPKTELGDAAFPVAFELARRIKQATGEKQNPRNLAETLAAKLRETENIARVEVAGAGYVNVYFDRARLLLALLKDDRRIITSDDTGARPKRMVEHTSINPNKAAHIGHVRNSVLGDTFVRILRAAHERVEVQNYIDNTGVQVADVVVGFQHIEKMTLAEVKKLDENLPANYPFDYYCWDLYAKVGLFYRNDDANAAPDPAKMKLRSDTLHAVEAGDNPTAELADYVATRNVEQILETMWRLGITYDLLPRESEILRLHFWDDAFKSMQAKGVIRLETEGKNAGCWVMPLADAHQGTDEHDADKILVRSNGTVTYTGKDIAYQLWKLGQLDLDFNYKLFHQYPDGQVAYITTEGESTGKTERPAFGGGATVYNVIDARQSYTQDVVKRGVAAVAPEIGAAASVHLSYEMVALTPAAAESLGVQLTDEDRARPFVEMSGRKGLGVKADDLINQLEERALAEVVKRHPDAEDAERHNIARIIAIGALRYFLLKFTRNTVIAFDFNEALAFEGETGAYCQNAAVRLNSIFRKFGAENLAAALKFTNAAGQIEEVAVRFNAFLNTDKNEDIWALVTLVARFDDQVRQTARDCEPAALAKYVFSLAKAFNLFYHQHRIIDETDEARRAALVAVALITQRTLTRALHILGIEIPEKM